MAPPRNRTGSKVAAVPATPDGPGTSSRSSGYRQRSYYLHDEVAARLRDTWWGTHHLPDCPTSMSDFVSLGVTLLCDLVRGRVQHREAIPSGAGAGAARAVDLGDRAAGHGDARRLGQTSTRSTRRRQ